MENTVNDNEILELLNKLRYSDERYRIAAENSNEIIIDYNLLDNSIYHVTDRITKVYGVPQKIYNAPEYLVNCGAVKPESVSDFLDLFRRLHTGEPQVSCTLKTKTISGEVRWCDIVLTSVFDENRRPVRAVGVLKDVTSLRIVEMQYENELQYRDAITKNALLHYEADLTNRKMLSDWKDISQSLGLSYTKSYDEAIELLISNIVHPDDRPALRITYNAAHLLEQHSAGTDKLESEYRRIRANGQITWVRGTAYIFEDPHTGIVRLYYYVNDINAEKLRALKFQEQAERDLLTGLYNKVTTEQLIRDAMERDSNNHYNGALFIVDLDDFKNINDQLGHAFGDAVLSETASRLQAMCRTDDIVGRVGGDEFMLYLKLPNVETVQRKAKELCEMFRHSYDSGEQHCKVSGTIGIAIFSQYDIAFEDLYKNADLALYEAKRKGKDIWHIYSKELAGTVKTTLPRAEIDTSSGKTFSQNINEYVFRILYESHDLTLGIQGILELIAQHFHFDRSYIYELGEDGKCRLAYEWHVTSEKAIAPALKTMLPEELQRTRAFFSGKDSYLIDRAREGSEMRRTYPPLEQLYFRLQYVLCNSADFQGFVGFDCYTPGCSLTSEDRISLQGVAQMLDVFIADRRATNKIVASGVMLQAVADSLHSCTYIIDPSTYLLYFVNQNARQIIPEAVPGSLCYETVRGRNAPCEDCPIVQMLQNGTREYQTEMYLDRYQLWAKNHTTLIHLADGKDYGLCNCYDFAEYKKQNGRYIVDADAFTDDTTLYNALTLSTDDYIYMCDMPKNLFYFPKNMVKEFGLPGQIIEDAIPLWASLIHEDERGTFLADLENMINGTDTHNLEYRAKNKDGLWIWLRCRGYLERDKDGNPSLFAGVITNIGRKNKIDYISGLQNKFEFEAHTRRKLADQPNQGALLLLGIDNFKYINDLFGWEFGDQVIREFGQQMQALLPAKAQLYRLDGDSFGMFLPESDRTIVTDYYQALYQTFQKPHTINDRQYYCTVSGGCALLQDTPLSFTAFFKQAEHALDYAKNEGKNQICFYDDNIMSGKARELALLNCLQECVNQDCQGFELYFQPQIEPITRTVTSAEALLRWRSPEFGLVSPSEFIPLLEHSGLINRVGRWVLIHAADICNTWREIQPDFTINVNLSFLQLQDKTFLPHLTGLVNSGRIDPEGLHLEITESSIAKGSNSLLSAFQSLRNLGFHIEMDDFGTGYSSLEILKNAPADVVKIDRAFVMDITRSDFDATFIQFIVSLCHSVDIKVCLEGVETWEEYYLVEPMELDLIQGFLFGRPQKSLDFEKNYINVERTC